MLVGAPQRDDEVPSPGMSPAKRHQAGRVELLGCALALDCDDITPPSHLEDEVDLVLLLVAPVVQTRDTESRRDLAEHKVFEELTTVLVAQRVPAAVIGDEPSVESVDLGLGPDLGSATTVVGPDHRGKQCRFEDREIALHSRSRHLARSRERLGLE